MQEEQPDVLQCKWYRAHSAVVEEEDGEAETHAKSSASRTSPSRRTESFRLATELHPVHSKLVKSPTNKPVCIKETDELSERHSQTETEDVHTLDDGYVNMRMTDSGLKLPSEEPSEGTSLYSNMFYHRASTESADSTASDTAESKQPCDNMSSNTIHRHVVHSDECHSDVNNYNVNGAAAGLVAGLEIVDLQSSSCLSTDTWLDGPVSGSSLDTRALCKRNSDEPPRNTCSDSNVRKHDKCRRNSDHSDFNVKTSEKVCVNSSNNICTRKVSECCSSNVCGSGEPACDSSRSNGWSGCLYGKRPYSSNPTSPLHGVDNPWIPRHRLLVSHNSNLGRRHKHSTIRRSSSLSSMLDSHEVARGKKCRHKNRDRFLLNQNTCMNAHTSGSGTPQAPGCMMSKEHKQIVSRYATPPRAYMDPVRMLQEGRSAISTCSVTSSGSARRPAPLCCSPSIPESMPRLTSRPPLPPLSSYSLPSQPLMSRSLCEEASDFQQFVDGIERGEGEVSPPNTSSKSSTLESQTDSLPDSSSGHSSIPPSPTLASPDSTHSNDSLVDSFKHAVFNFTHRLTGRSPRSLESSPRRTARTRSVGALEELHVDSKDKKRTKFVYQLARAYSDRIKNKDKERYFTAHCKTDKEHSNSALAHQLASLLSHNKPGSCNLGARIATAKPIVLGTYTLPRQRPPRPKRTAPILSKPRDRDEDQASDYESSQTDCHVRLTREEYFKAAEGAHDSGVLDMGVKGLHLEDHEERRSECRSPPVDGEVGVVQLHHADDLDTESKLYYYENKFMEDLEIALTDEEFRDSAVYSDEGTNATLDLDPNGFKISIRDTVRLIEQRYQAKPVAAKISIKRVEKPAHGIREILKNLEACTSPESKDKDNVDACADKVPFKSIRDRTRELVECATLTRIRQNTSCVDDTHHAVLEEVDQEAGEEIATAKIGWVKQVVSQFQHDTDK